MRINQTHAIFGIFPTRFLPAFLILVTFGPYISTGLGLRLDHLVIYPLFGIYLLTFLLKNPKVNKPLCILFSLWLFMTLWTFTVTCFSLYEGIITSKSLVISRMENYTQPMALFFILMLVKFSDRDDRQKILFQTIHMTLFLLFLNSIWATLSIFLDFEAINLIFRGGPASYSEELRLNFRYTGTIGQPLEAGNLYSFALICWVYMLLKRKEHNLHPVWMLMLLGGAFLGGVLSISKIFLGGVCLFVAFLTLSMQKQMYKTLGVALIIGSILLSAFSVYQSNTDQQEDQKWGFKKRLGVIFEVESLSDFYRIYLATRLSQRGYPVIIFREVSKKAPLQGLGFGKYISVDSGYMEKFGQGGWVALIVFFASLFFIVWKALLLCINHSTRLDGIMIICIMAQVLAACIGAPSFTANRVGVVLCCIIGMTFIKNSKSNSPELANLKPTLAN